AQHGGSSEAHFLARALWQGTDGQIAEGSPGVRATTFPLPDHVVPLRDEVGGAPEIQVRESSTKFRGEPHHVLAAAAGRMHRVFEADIWGRQFVDDGRVPRVAPEFGKPPSDNRLVLF